MSRILNLRAKIVNALLERDEVCGPLIAKEIGCAPESAAFVLRELSQYLAKRAAPEEPGKNRIYYSAVDREGLIRERDMKRGGGNQWTTRVRLSFDGLLQAWNIAPPRGCTLPSLVHRMETPEDQLFEEAA
ncbi:hypothetical protein [Cupriavidus sp.]|uniref:hypothetical protein n=1 Tax=Cupriavidus sp. TaxID=1873897 RepID=UPI0025C6A015|nr:hypothetical protein [Cupriavidus sp.]MCA3188299.1 hypothetical protein [Cupriavidus sp.]MCA3189847.1 hypothetical protein [Cupriavidus sp.]MCA3196441.1 hypothetical protein [Cupriavidus sp.]MCA3202186.1 hypothetical protein [Cupriavidus sp.]MCA3233422.1 hypothetical protein [Cupriavidus sp.]